jgi:hypothetical protein
MLKKETLQTAATVAIGFGIAFLVVGSSQTFQSCIGEHYHHEPSETFQKGVAQFLVMLKVGSGCTGEFVHKNAESIIALFTVILGIATWLLWRATKKLVEGAEATAKRQLRAYVLALDARVYDFGITEIIEVQCRIKNYGQTPAYDVVGWMGATLNDFPNPTDLGRPPADLGLSRAVIGPQGRTVFRAQVSRLLTGLEFQKIRSGASTIYVFGEVTYRDVFNDKWTSHFRFMYGGAGGENRKGKVSTCQDGNYETQN